MQVEMEITSVTKISDEKLLVQLQGTFGNAQLSLPIDQAPGLVVGKRFILTDLDAPDKTLGLPVVNFGGRRKIQV